MIEIRNLTKKYGDKTAVQRLTLTVARGECYAFLGPNGAGKTTTLKVVAGLLRPTAGTVRVCGHDIVEEAQAAKERMAYVPDEPYLYEKLSGREFLTFVADMYGIGRDALKRHIDRFTELFELDEYLDDLCEGYSHGMKQRVVLTAALLHDPEALVVDEPTVGLDPRGARLLKNLLRERARQGVTLLLSTHSLSVAEDVADRIGIIHRGRLIAEGTLEELRRGSGGEEGLEEMFLRITEDQGGAGSGRPGPAERPQRRGDPCPSE